MADYEVGKVFINLTSSANIACKELDKITTSLTKLSKVNIDNVTENLRSIGKIDFSPLKKSLNSLKNIDTKSINSVSKAINSLKKLSDSNIDFGAIKTNIEQLTAEIEPFVSRIEKAGPSLSAFSNALDLSKVNPQLLVTEARVNAINSKTQSKKVLDDVKIEKANVQLEITKKKLEQINNSSKKTGSLFGKVFSLGKLYAFYNYSKRTAQAVAKMMTSAIDFNETLNKFQVSMGSYYQQSIKFVNSLAYAFNLSTESIMNYQSTFKNMLDSLGSLKGNTNYELSETFTRMVLDYASLFNISIDKAMQQFQSVLSGQIRSIRTTSGYDVSEASIFEIYKNLGGTKSMRQLDQLEKRLLRIIALQEQMSRTGAVGDFEKTINETAQQLKQLSETLKEIGRWIGQLTLVYLQPFIEKLLAATIVVRELLKSLNIAKGYKYKAPGEGGLFGEVEESAENAEEATQSLKKNLLGFDTLNILGSSSSNTNLPDYSLLTDQIKKYQSSLDKVKNTANEIAEKILTWLGYTKEITTYTDENGNEISETSWKLGEDETKLRNILDILEKISKAIIAIAIAKAALSAITTISTIGDNLSKLGKIFNFLTSPLGIILTIFALLYTTNEDFRKSVNQLVGTLITALLPIIEIVEKIIKELMPIITIILDLLADILVPILNLITPLIETIGKAIVKVIEPLIPIIEVFIEVVIGSLESIAEFIKAIVDSVVAIFEGDFDKLKKIWSDLGEKLKTIWSNVWDSIKGTLISIVNKMISTFSKFVNLLTSGINKITKTLSKAWTWLGIPAIPEIPEWHPSLIPELANGGVITSPTMAMVGEYANARSNPEIVTPENLMRQTFTESMLPLAQIITNGNQKLIDAIEDLSNRPIELNGRKVSENIYEDLQQTAIRKGQIMFAK